MRIFNKPLVEFTDSETIVIANFLKLIDDLNGMGIDFTAGETIDLMYEISQQEIGTETTDDTRRIRYIVKED